MAISKITTKGIADDSVTSAKLASGAVTISDIPDSEITADKLHTTLDLSTKTLTLTQASVTAHQSALSVTQSQISDLSTTSDLTEGTNLYYTDSRADARAQIKVDALVDAAPGTLDTLNELAAALGDDPNFATTVTNSIATKLPLAGGTMTGNVSFGDNDKAVFGGLLEIYGDGNHARIREYGSGQMKIQGDNMQLLTSAGTSTYLEGNASTGAVTLYHLANAPRISTTATGVDVTGTVTADGLTVDGTAVEVVSINSTQNGAQINFDSASTTNDWSIGISNSADGDFLIYQNAAAGAGDLRLYTNGQERLTILSGGNVGIGTTNPGEKLEVNGVLQIKRDGDHPALRFVEINSGTSTTRGYIASGDWAVNGGAIDDLGISSSNTGDLLLATNAGSERLRIQSSTGNVGIGTSSPVDRLHIYGNEGNSTMGIVLQDDGWGAPNGQYKLTVRNSDGAFVIRKNTSTNFDFATADDHLVLTSSGGEGRLGIGTNSPQGNLHVNGGPVLIGVSDDWHQSSQSSVGTTIIRGGYRTTTIDNNTTALKIYNAAANNNKTAGNYGNGIGFMHLDPETYGSSYTGQHAWIGLRIIDTPAQERSALVFATNDNTTAGSFPLEKMTIMPNGNVGIGNNNPGYHIDARGGSATGDGMRVKTGDNGYDGLIVSNSAILKCYPAAGQSVSLQAYNSSGSTKTGVKVTGADTPAGEISTKLEFVTELLGHNVYDNGSYGTSSDQYVDLEDWSPTDFRILEIFGTANPNSGGSGAYADPVHMYVYNGTGWNGAEVTYYVYGKSVAPLARDMFGSGSGSSANVAEVWWYNPSTTAQQDAATSGTASGYHLRLKFPNTNTNNTMVSLKVIKRA